MIPRDRARRIGLLLGLVLAWIACGSDEARLAGHLERAEQYSEAGKPAEAMIELRNALKLDPNDADTNFRLGRLMEEQGRLADAVFYYRETTRLDPQNSEAALAEAFLLYTNDPDRAEELVENVLDREPDNLIAHVRRSDLALVRVDTPAALAAALTAAELDPTDLMARLQVGLVHKARISELMQLGEDIPDEIYRDAIAAFEKGIELAGDSTERAMRAWVERAEVYAGWPEHQDEAAQAFRDAVEAAPNDDMRALALQSTELYARRVRNLDLHRWAVQRLIELQPDRLERWSRMAWLIEQEQGDVEAFWQERLAAHPKSAEASVLYAKDLARRNLHPQAIVHLQERLEQVDEPAELGTFLSDLLIARGRIPEARSVIVKLEALDPGSPDHDLAKANLALAEGRTGTAVELARAAAGRNDSADAQRILAEAELRRSNVDAALAAAERAIDLAGERPAPALLRLRARVALRAGDWPGAIRFFQQGFIAAGGLWTFNDRVGMAQALYAMGRNAQARDALEFVLDREQPYLPAVFMYAAQERERDPERVRRLLESVLERLPDNWRARVELAQLDVEQGRLEAGLKRLDQGLERNPNLASLYAVRAQLLLQADRPAEAEADARRALEIEPDLAEATDMLARILLASGRAGQAVAELQKGIDEGRIPIRSRILLARLLRDLGQPDKAAEVYESMLASGVNSAALKNDYALLIVKYGGDIDRALQLAREAQDLAPESPATADTLGVTYLAKGLPDAARNQIEFALELIERRGQDQPTIRYHHGLVLKRLGLTEEALVSFERALEVSQYMEFPEAEDARREIEKIKAGDTAS